MSQQRPGQKKMAPAMANRKKISNYCFSCCQDVQVQLLGTGCCPHTICRTCLDELQPQWCPVEDCQMEMDTGGRRLNPRQTAPRKMLKAPAAAAGFQDHLQHTMKTHQFQPSFQPGVKTKEPTQQEQKKMEFSHPCAFKFINCTFQGTEAELDEHNRQCIEHHASLMANEIRASVAANQQMIGQLKQEQKQITENLMMDIAILEENHQLDMEKQTGKILELKAENDKLRNSVSLHAKEINKLIAAVNNIGDEVFMKHRFEH